MKKYNAGLWLGMASTVVAIPAASTWAMEQQINLQGAALPYCSFTADPTFSNPTNITVDSAARPASIIHITNPATPSGFMQTAKFTFLIQTTCNAPSNYRLTTQNGGLTNSAPLPLSGSWLNRIDYSAHVTLPAAGGDTSSLITSGVAGVQSDLALNGVAYAGQLQVSFQTINNPSAPLVAGNYSDTLTITVIPQ